MTDEMLARCDHLLLATPAGIERSVVRALETNEQASDVSLNASRVLAWCLRATAPFRIILARE